MTLLEHDKEAFEAEHYDRKYFEGHVVRYERGVYKQRVANVMRFMGDVKGRRVLDLGCGVGFFGGEAARRGARVTGLDFSERALELCHERLPQLALLRADATRVPLASASFDVVLVNDIIEHLAEDLGRAMMKEVHRLLRPGGRLVLDTDNDAFLFHRKGFRRLNDWLERDTPQRVALREIKRTWNAPTLHIRIYSVAELRALIEGAGFTVEAFDTYTYIDAPGRDRWLNLPGVASLLRNVKGDVQIYGARKT
jgi:2-polyprenyl-3-methyl-5-hydroxy-6-metoxy-1,4-benzoquinol methylase